jgi:hypothetical protein
MDQLGKQVHKDPRDFRDLPEQREIQESTASPDQTARQGTPEAWVRRGPRGSLGLEAPQGLLARLERLETQAPQGPRE